MSTPMSPWTVDLRCACWPLLALPAAAMIVAAPDGWGAGRPPRCGYRAVVIAILLVRGVLVMTGS